MSNNSHQINLNQYIWQFVKEFKIYIISLIIIAILAGIFDVSVNYKVKEIIDIIAADKTANLNYLLGLFVFYKLMHHGVFFISRLLGAKYKPIILEQVITDVYSKTVKHSLHWFDSHLSGEISNKIADFQSSIPTLIVYLFHCFNIIATIIIGLLFLTYINLYSAFILLLFILIYTPILYLLIKKQMVLQEQNIKARQETIGIINDSIANIFGIKIIGNLLTEFKLKLKPAITKWKSCDQKALDFDTYYVDNADTLIVVIMSAAQIYLLAYLYKSGEITAGSFAFVAMLTLNIHSQLDDFLENLLFNINPKIAQLKSSYEFINSPIDVIDKEGASILTNVKGIIEYNNVSFSYGKRRKQILHNFNLKINPGEKVGIVGESGAGKTTIIKCLLRYFDINKGALLIDNQDIRDITQESLRNEISIIPQDITMFHRSIRNNLKLAKHDATDEEIISACKKAKIHDDIISMANGYDTIVGERGVKLSGGQRQRIAIARAILKDAAILILDEATSSLDSPTERLIQESINEILESNKATVIAIAHRLSTLKNMDRIIVLDKGNIAETGTHNELIKRQDGLYKKLWEMQAI